MNMKNVIAPRVKMRYRQPQLSALLHCPMGVPEGHEKLGMKAQASSEAIKLPTGQKTESSVKRFPDVWGRNSRNKAPSTGRFPPTPRPIHAYSAHVPIQLGPPPEARPKTPARKRVKLKARRRPIMSDAVPQKDAPMQRPRKSDSVVYLTSVSLTPNSALS